MQSESIHEVTVNIILNSELPYLAYHLNRFQELVMGNLLQGSIINGDLFSRVEVWQNWQALILL